VYVGALTVPQRPNSFSSFSSVFHVYARLRHVSSAGKQARHALKTSGTRARARLATETCERAQFLINSTLKAEKEVQQQRASNELLANELARLTALFQERRGTVLEAKEEALSAVAQLCALQLREKRSREEEEHESSSSTREAALLQMAVADHRKVQVLSQALGMAPLITSSAPVAGSSIMDATSFRLHAVPCAALPGGAISLRSLPAQPHLTLPAETWMQQRLLNTHFAQNGRWMRSTGFSAMHLRMCPRSLCCRT
jgi:hypothetical protein